MRDDITPTDDKSEASPHFENPFDKIIGTEKRITSISVSASWNCEKGKKNIQKSHLEQCWRDLGHRVPVFLTTTNYHL